MNITSTTQLDTDQADQEYELSENQSLTQGVVIQTCTVLHLQWRSKAILIPCNIMGIKRKECSLSYTPLCTDQQTKSHVVIDIY